MSPSPCQTNVTAQPDRRITALTVLIIGGLCLGVSPVVVKAIALPPEVSAFYRVLFATPAFAAIALLSPRTQEQRGRPRRPSVLLYSVTALLFAADLAIMHVAIRMTDVAIATLFTNCAPFFVGFMSLVGLTERPSPRFWQALPVALSGIILLIGITPLAGGAIAGDFLALSAAIFYAGYIVSVRELRARGARPAWLMVGVTIASTVLLFPLFWRAGAPIPSDAATWLLLLVLVLVGQIAGQGLVTIALRDLPASLGSVVLLVQPVVAAVLSWVLLAERLSLLQSGGIILVLAAITIATTGSRS